jgi:hypothetical protein
MKPAERALLEKALSAADCFFEIGCGGSTQVAAASPVRCITSVDSSSEWVKKVTVRNFRGG